MDWQAENLLFVAFIANSEQMRCDEIYRDVFKSDFEEVAAEPGPLPGRRASGFTDSVRQSIITRPGRVDLVIDAPRNDPPMVDAPISQLLLYLPQVQKFFGELNPSRVSCVANLVRKCDTEQAAIESFYNATGLNFIEGASELHFRYNKVRSVNNYKSNFIFDHSVVQLQFIEFQVAGGQPVGPMPAMKSIYYFKKSLDFNSVPSSEIPSEDVAALLDAYVKEIDLEASNA